MITYFYKNEPNENEIVDNLKLFLIQNLINVSF